MSRRRPHNALADLARFRHRQLDREWFERVDRDTLNEDAPVGVEVHTGATVVVSTELNPKRGERRSRTKKGDAAQLTLAA
jgi:hypothetical protein